MSEFEQNEADNTFEESPRAIRRRERAQRRAERRAALTKKGNIAWPVVLMAGGASAVVSSLVVSVGVVATAAGDSGPDPKAMSMLVQQVSDQSAAPADAQANRGAPRSSDRGRASSGSRKSSGSISNKRGATRQASTGRKSGSASRPSGHSSRPAPSRSGGRPPAPPVNNPGGKGPDGNGPGGVDNIPVIGDIVALIKGLIDMIQNGVADGGKPGGDEPGNGNGGGKDPGPFGSSGRDTQPTRAELAAVLEDGEEGIPTFTRVVSCLNDLDVPIEDPTDKAAPMPLPNLFNAADTANGSDILRIIITEITTKGKLSSETLAELDEHTEALCR